MKWESIILRKEYVHIHYDIVKKYIKKQYDYFRRPLTLKHKPSNEWNIYFLADLQRLAHKLTIFGIHYTCTRPHNTRHRLALNNDTNNYGYSKLQSSILILFTIKLATFRQWGDIYNFSITNFNNTWMENLNDKPTSIWSWSMARNQCWTLHRHNKQSGPFLCNFSNTRT